MIEQTPKASPLRRAGFFMAMVAIVVGASLLLCVGAELILRSTGKFRTWSELHDDGYVSPTDPSQFWLPFIGKDNHESFEYLVEQPEFVHHMKTNSLGLREDEIVVPKPAGTRRIVGLGDSFAMGYGVEKEDTYLEVMERALADRYPDQEWETVNAGVAGHDPVFSEQLLRRRLLPLQPDIVLLLVNQSDVFDIVSRGGVDRFDGRGAVRPRGSWAWESAFRYSHLARAVAMARPRTGGTNWLHWEKLGPEDEEFAGRVIGEVATSLADLGEEMGFHLLLVAHPHRYQMTQRPLDPTFKYLDKPDDQEFFQFLDTVFAFRAAVGWGRPWSGPVGTPAPARDETLLAPYFYPVDGHYPPAGQALLAREVLAALEARGWVGVAPPPRVTPHAWPPLR